MYPARREPKKLASQKRALLTASHVVQRIDWAQVHLNFMLNDWKAQLFSDKCSVDKSKDPRTDWVFCAPNKKYDNGCIHGVIKDPRVKLIVRACIWGCNKGLLIPIFEKETGR